MHACFAASCLHAVHVLCAMCARMAVACDTVGDNRGNYDNRSRRGGWDRDGGRRSDYNGPRRPGLFEVRTNR